MSDNVKDSGVVKSPQLSEAEPGSSKFSPKVLAAASIGTFIEYFDLVVFGALSAVLATVFFPQSDDTAALLSVFAVFAVAFIARPLGGLFWGPLGDRIGRQRTLAAIIIVMSVATAFVGLLPGYATIGVWAPLLLVLLRLVQGLSVGGELPGAAIFVAEYSPNDQRAFRTSFISAALHAAQLAALVVAFLLVALLSEEQMQNWGWRLPFLVALPMGAVGLYIRSRLEETPAFEQVEQEGAKASSPLKALVKEASGRKMLGRAILFQLPILVPGFMLFTFMPSYLKNSAGMPAGTALLCIAAVAALIIALCPIAGRLSDRFGRRPMLFVVAWLTLVLAYPAFALLQMDGVLMPILGLLCIGLVHGIGVGGAQLAPVLESFPTKLRYTGFALAVGITTAAVTGPTPYVAQWLVNSTGNLYSPAWLLMAVALPSAIGVFFIKDSHRQPLDS